MANPSLDIPSRSRDTPSLTHQSLLDLFDHLDTVWAQYLDQVAAYQNAQAALQKNFSAAFFALAQANFAKASGRRYGRDYYDGRAIASLRTEIRPRAADLDHGVVKIPASIVFQLKQVAIPAPQRKTEKGDEDSDTKQNGSAKSTKYPQPSPPIDENVEDDDDVVDTASTSAKQDSKRHLPTPSSTLGPVSEFQLPKTTEGVKKRDECSSDDDKLIPEPTDPLRAFAGGLLIPPALRKAHQSFATALTSQDTVFAATNAARALRDLEVEINRTRKAIRKMERDVPRR